MMREIICLSALTYGGYCSERLIVGTAFGCLAFLLMFLGDLNDWRFRIPVLRFSFPVGFVMLAASSAALLGLEKPEPTVIGRYFFIVMAAAFFLLLIFSLFFSLPAREAYLTQEKKRPVCTTGLYSLCRHPGFLCFFFLYIALHFAFGFPWIDVFLFSALNFALILFEDRIVFPSCLADYGAYKETTPFLLPGFRYLHTFFKKK